MNIDEIRAKKLADMQAQMQDQSEETQFASQLAQLEAIIRLRMTKEAITRLGNLKAAHPTRAAQAIAVIAQFMQSGKIQIIDDIILKDILERLQPEKKEFKFTRK